jgi:hypothetical protein
VTPRLGWLGPAIVLAGLAIGGVMVWFMISASPTPGDAIDTIPIEGDTRLVVRAEQGGDRAFLELDDGDDVRWRALVPHYAGGAGRPGVAWGRDVATIRVERDGQQELWVFALKDAAKLADLKLAPEHQPIPPQTTEPVTLTDHIRSYEIVTGKGWHQIVGIDLSGKALWKVELGPERITFAGVDGGHVVIDQAGSHRLVDVVDGRTNPATQFRLPL